MKTFLLDTNIFLYDPYAFKVFKDNEVVIPICVLDELDNAKTRADEVGRNARLVTRTLDDLRSLGNLSEGVKLKDSLIRVELKFSDNIPEGLSIDKMDNKILSTAIGLKNSGKNVIVVSKDINLRVKCDVCGIEAQDYKKDRIAENVESIYGGVQKIFVDSKIIDDLYSNKKVEIKDFAGYLNQFIIMKSNSQENHVAIGKYIGNDTIIPIKQVKDLFGICARNAEQRMAIDLLLDPNINLVTLIGSAGTGKTLLAIAAAMHQISSINKINKIYERVLISRPVQPMGKDIGYLPGSLEDKLKPWMLPIYDNLDFLLGTDYQSTSMYDGLIQVEPLTYIRGRSIPKSFMIVDEAQNLSKNEIKTIITRMGEKSKIILTGDIQQIDNNFLNPVDNGLSIVVEKFKEYSISGHITLLKGERSELANLAANIL